MPAWKRRLYFVFFLFGSVSFISLGARPPGEPVFFESAESPPGRHLRSETGERTPPICEVPRSRGSNQIVLHYSSSVSVPVSRRGPALETPLRDIQRGPAGGGRSVCIGAPSRSGRQGIGGTRVCVKSETLLNETFALRACLAKTNRWLVAATTLREVESNVRESTSQKNAPRSPECRTLSSRDLASSLNASTDP